MKPLRLQVIIFALALAGAAGCSQKKPVLVAPQQPPPTAAPEPSPTPEPAQTTEQQPAEQQAEPQTTPSAAEQANTAPAKSKAKNGSTTTRKTTAPAPAGQKPGNEVARSTPSKKVIPADKTATTPPAGIQISPAPTPADGASTQASTEQLLQRAESNLNGINRQLSKDEEAMKGQIREFINQSHKATTENDPARAHNYAVKARLLSDELVKQR
jgi:hypothetical protein